MKFSAIYHFLDFVQNIETIIDINFTNIPFSFNLHVFFTDEFPRLAQPLREHGTYFSKVDAFMKMAVKLITFLALENQVFFTGSSQAKMFFGELMLKA